MNSQIYPLADIIQTVKAYKTPAAIYQRPDIAAQVTAASGSIQVLPPVRDIAAGAFFQVDFQIVCPVVVKLLGKFMGNISEFSQGGHL